MRTKRRFRGGSDQKGGSVQKFFYTGPGGDELSKRMLAVLVVLAACLRAQGAPLHCPGDQGEGVLCMFECSAPTGTWTNGICQSPDTVGPNCENVRLSQICYRPDSFNMSLIAFEHWTTCNWDACHAYTNKASLVGLDASMRTQGTGFSDLGQC